jgi:hypothetical protein
MLCWEQLHQPVCIVNKFPRYLRLCALLPAVFFAGCGSLQPLGQKQYVYVVTKQTYLRDRVAVIAAHVENIYNGERLEVVQRDGRFYRVKTPDGKVGWLEEHSVITQAEFDKFDGQAKAHAHDPVVATATLLNESNLHLGPGRKVEHFYILPANDRLELLERASVPKPLPPQALLAPRSLKPRARAFVVRKPEGRNGSTIFAETPAFPDRYTAPDLQPDQPWMGQPMEDWWLVREQTGKVGWLLSRSFNVNVPDDVAQYSEGRRIVGAYLLNTVMDDGQPPPKPERVLEAEAKVRARKAKARARHPAGGAAAAQAEVPTGPMPTPHPVGQWLTVTSEFKDGLPFDWDQVRVFIWNTRKHRYETAYRLHDLQGYLPVTTGKEMVDKMGEEPTFVIRTSPDGVATQDTEGVFHPKTVVRTQYRLEGGIVRRDTPLPGKPGDDAGAAGGKAVGKPERHAGNTPHRGSGRGVGRGAGRRSETPHWHRPRHLH